jgi:uncharacterized damage-inducible protein DinB
MGSAMSDMFAHNTWANVRVIDVCSKLSGEQLDGTAEGTYGSIRDTLVHIIEAEESYLFRLNGERFDPPVTDQEWPGFDLLRSRAQEIGAGFERVIAEDDPGRAVTWTRKNGDTPSMPMGMFLVQTINHGNEHRSQLATVLTHLGIEPPELSGWLYAIETGVLVGLTD